VSDIKEAAQELALKIFPRGKVAEMQGTVQLITQALKAREDAVWEKVEEIIKPFTDITPTDLLVAIQQAKEEDGD